MKDESVIPAGHYCYELLSVIDGRMQIKPCPYWSVDRERDSQNNGYCAFLGRGDWEVDVVSLLWDQCKECGINTDVEVETEAP